LASGVAVASCGVDEESFKATAVPGVAPVTTPDTVAVVPPPGGCCVPGSSESVPQLLSTTNPAETAHNSSPRRFFVRITASLAR
jgi:hypothetical protein